MFYTSAVFSLNNFAAIHTGYGRALHLDEG